MEKEFKCVYDYLSNISRLQRDEYKKLVSVYGKKLVDSVIEYIIDKDENTIHKFDYYVEMLANNVDNVVGKSVLQFYIDDVKRIPRLMVEENEIYAKEAYKIVNELKRIFSNFDCKYVNQKGIIFNSILDEVSFYSDKCDDTDILWRMKELSERFVYIRNKLVEGNIRIVIAAYKTKYKDDDSYLELLQYGNIGLMKAVEKFNPNCGALFSTYAYFWIKQFFRVAYKSELHTGVSISYKALEQNNSRLRTVDTLSQELGRIPTREEISSNMGVSEEKLRTIEASVPFSVIMSSKIISPGDDDGKSLSVLESCADDDVNVEDEAILNLLKPHLISVMEKYLTERQKFILLNRFGFYGKELTFREIGEMLGVSKQYVEQQHTKALTKLKIRAYSKLHDFIK